MYVKCADMTDLVEPIVTSKAKGVTISITAETNAGGRRYMEDYLAVKLSPNEDFCKLPHLREQAYVGVFDGHGGKEAAKYARDRLWDIIQNQPKYLLPDVKSVKESLEEAYVALHEEMEPLRATWKKHRTGELSTAGTTASTVIFRQDHIFVANVGDSTAVLAVTNPQTEVTSQHPVKAIVLTKDHKPEDPDENDNIQVLGGCVRVSRKGTPRVVWERQRKEGKEGYDCIPFLGVSRSLGDFWSFNPRTKQFIVSPKPDVYVHPLNPKKQKFVVIASDGLWNVMTPDEVVRFIWDYENASSDDQQQPRDVVRAVINKALDRWAGKRYPADNIAVLIAFLSESSVVNSCPRHLRTVPSNCVGEAQETPTSESRTDDVEGNECETSTKPPESQYPKSIVLVNDVSLSVEVEKLSGLTDRSCGIVDHIPSDLNRCPPAHECSPSKLISIGKHISTDNASELVPSLKRSKLDCSPSDLLNCADKVDSPCGLQTVKQLSEILDDDDSGVHSDDASSEDVANLSEPAASSSACVSN